MARGDRSRPERTPEERERDRAERERRRGRPGNVTAAEPASLEPAPTDGKPLPEQEEPIGGEPPLAAEPAQEEWLVEPPPSEPEAEQVPLHAEPPEEASPQEPPGAEPLLPEPLPPEEQVSGHAAGESDEEPATRDLGPPATAAAGGVAGAEASRVPEQPAEHSAGEDSEPLAGEELSGGPEAAEAPRAGQDAEPDLAAGTAEEAHEEDSTTAPAAVDPPPEAAERLPPPPPRVRARNTPPMRRAFKRAGAGAGAVSAGHRRGRRGGLPASRLAALVALIAVAVAVVLLIRSLTGSSTSKPPPAAPVVKVLIPEGKTRVQIAQIAATAGLKGDYRRAARRSPLLNPVHYGAPAGTPDLEGFLFPATYDMDPGAPVGRLVEEQLTAFQENFGAEDAARAHALGVTPYQLLTVASMVEREAQVPGDRAKIAAVIYNRLKAGMPLGIDASIYYAVEMEKGIATYTHELTEAQLHINSPYNTRTHVGLPPTPISNPGTASINAAAHPANVTYLYYVAGADGCGEQVFSDTQAKFEANVAAYEAAKRNNGGNPPKCKHG